MARRKRGKGGRFVKASGTTRRRRRSTKRRNPPVALAANPPRRRRRSTRRRSVSVVRSSPRRRSSRRLRANPPAFLRNLGLGSQLQAAKDGTAVVGGQVVTRKIRGAVQGMLPATVNVSSGLAQVGVTAASAGLVTFLTRYLPSSVRGYARFVAAGAWSEAINTALAQTPVAVYLSAFPNRRVLRVAPGGRAVNGRGVSAYPSIASPRMSAYPAMRQAGVTVGA